MNRGVDSEVGEIGRRRDTAVGPWSLPALPRRYGEIGGETDDVAAAVGILLAEMRLVFQIQHIHMMGIVRTFSLSLGGEALAQLNTPRN